MRRFRTSPGHARRAGGFTLLEVLLAFVVFALSFAAVLEILGGSMRSSIRARDYTEAALLGQSLMELVGTEIPVAEGAYSGEAPGGYVWEMYISPYLSIDDGGRTLELATLAAAEVYRVDLEIAWGEPPRERRADFSTIRSVLAQQP